MSLKNFQILQNLGVGSYASVFKVRRLQDHVLYALKKVKLWTLSEKQRKNALNEIRILASISHPNIISYKDAFLEQETGTLCLVTEFADMGDLQQKISSVIKQQSNICEEQIWGYLTQIARGLKALHSANIVHRDIKCANVFLFKDGRVKIGDMNVSKVLQGHLCGTQTGTPYYASPEVWKDQPYDAKSDVWSLGCIIYEMVTLHPPFQAKNMEALYKKVIKGIYPKLSEKYSKKLRSLIRTMLQVNSNYRPNINSLFLSPFMSNRGIQNQQQGQQHIYLMETIKVPRKITNLQMKLPKSKYEIKKKSSMKLLPCIQLKKFHTKSVSSSKFISQSSLPAIQKHIAYRG